MYSSLRSTQQRWPGMLAVLVLVCFSVTPSPAAEKLTIGLIPEMNVFAQIQRYQPLADYLSQELDIEISLTMLSRYGNIIERMKDSEVDAAFLGSFTGALAISQLRIEPLARPINLDGTSTYHGNIFVRKDSNIRTADDMRGKTIAFVERATTAGYVFPLAWLKTKGIDDYRHFFSEYFFAGSHDAAIDAVLKRTADIGSAKNTIYDYYMAQNPNAGEQLVILASSVPVPSNGLCVLPRVDTKLKEQLRSTLLSLHSTEKGKKVLAALRAIKFVKTDPDDYEPVMKMARDAGIDLENYYYENR